MRDISFRWLSPLVLLGLSACPTPPPPPPPELLFPAQAGELVAADLNGDGLPDLAASSGTDAFVFFGRGNDEFSPPVTVSLAPLVLRATLSATDLDADGAAELIATGTLGDQSHRVQVFRASGESFSAAEQVELSGGIFASPYHAVADFDADGAPDLAVIQNDQVFVYPGTAGGFGGTPQIVSAGIDVLSRSLSTGDFDGDGRQDLAGCGDQGGVVLFGASSAQGATLEAPQVLTDASLIKTRTGDLDGDGRPEFLAVARNNTTPRAFSLGSDRVATERVLGAIGGTPGSAAHVGYIDFTAADYNNDGTLDLAALRLLEQADGSTARDAAASLQQVGGALDFAGTVPLPVEITSNNAELEASDLDGDGLPDVVISDSDRLRVLTELAPFFAKGISR